jgi:hypothetical protein
MSRRENRLHRVLVDAFVCGTNRQRTFARGLIRQSAASLDVYRLKDLASARRGDGATWKEQGEFVIASLEGPKTQVGPDALRVLLESRAECEADDRPPQ